MKSQDIHITRYKDSLHDPVLKMEKGITQGAGIRLEILKDHFLDRAKLFDSYYSNLAMKGDNVIGTAIGSITTLVVNGESLKAGFGFDAKVAPGMRKMGIGKMLAKDLYKNFFRPNGLVKCFMTAKLKNAPILKVVSKALGKVWLYKFVYLTIPTSVIIDKKNSPAGKPQHFSIGLYDPTGICKSYYASLASGLGYFHTWKMYKLRIKKISWIYKQGISVLKRLVPSRYRQLPKEGDEFSFATLFNHHTNNISDTNELLGDLKKQNIHYLLVCCGKGDAIYNYLKQYSINTFNYYLVSDFSLNESDFILMDVRCL